MKFPLLRYPPTLLQGANSYSSFKAQPQTTFPCRVVAVYLSSSVSLPVSSSESPLLETSDSVLVASAIPESMPRTEWHTGNAECMDGWMMDVQGEFNEQ